MAAFCRRQPLPLLAASLQQLDSKLHPDPYERHARAVMIDVICERCPEAEAAFAAWADSDSMNIRKPVAAIVAAAKRSK